jgi:hypothetical protein
MTNTSSETNKEYFEVNFIKNSNVRPETVKAGDIADILKSIEGMVESQVYKTHPDTRKEQIVIGFTNIRASSVDLQFYSPYQDIATATFQELGQAINDNDYSRLPTPSYKAGNAIAMFSRKYKCDAEVIHQNDKKKVLAKITPDTILVHPPALKGETTVYAKVIRVGGKEPKVEIETVDGLTLFCTASYDIATKLGEKLYQIVGLIGVAEWDTVLNNIDEFSIKEVTEYKRTPLKEAMRKLADATSKYYLDIKDVDQYISEIRGSN